MAKYQSRYARLMFTVDKQTRFFVNGVYETTDKEEIEVLDKLTLAHKVEGPKKKKDEEPKEVKSTAKKSTRKDSE